MPKSLLDAFRNLDDATKQLVADIPSTLFHCFAALSLANTRAGQQRLSAEHIVACLEAAGVSVKKKSVSRALARASDRISTTKGLDGDTLYRLMTKGEREVAHYFGGGSLSVVRVDGSTPRTARQTLSEILGLLDESVSICDPYYGVRTLESLDCIPKATPVRFLTAKTNESPQKLSGPFRDFVKERPKVQFRQTSSHSLHDRYVVTSRQLLILGHGLKDIGAKESFIIRLGSTLIPDLVKQIIRSFDEHWKSATEIK